MDRGVSQATVNGVWGCKETTEQLIHTHTHTHTQGQTASKDGVPVSHTICAKALCSVKLSDLF